MGENVATWCNIFKEKKGVKSAGRREPIRKRRGRELKGTGCPKFCPVPDESAQISLDSKLVHMFPGSIVILRREHVSFSSSLHRKLLTSWREGCLQGHLSVRAFLL